MATPEQIPSQSIKVLGTDDTNDDIQIKVNSDGEIIVEPFLDIDISSITRDGNNNITQIVSSYNSRTKTLDLTYINNLLSTITITIT